MCRHIDRQKWVQKAANNKRSECLLNISMYIQCGKQTIKLSVSCSLVIRGCTYLPLQPI